MRHHRQMKNYAMQYCSFCHHFLCFPLENTSEALIIHICTTGDHSALKQYLLCQHISGIAERSCVGYGLHWLMQRPAF